MKKRTALAALLAGTVLSAASAHAAPTTINITSISGIWQDDVPDAAVSGEGTSTISWGTPASAGGQSSYTFTPTSTPFSVEVLPPPQATFDIGTFTHSNFPVFDATLQTVNLVVTTQLNIGGGTSETVESTFAFTHLETTNVEPCPDPSGTPCSDQVTFETVSSGTETFEVDGDLFFVDIAGFLVGGVVEDEFWTEEGLANNADLQGVIRAEAGIAEVPVAPTMLLLGMGLIGLGGYVRAQNRKA